MRRFLFVHILVVMISVMCAPILAYSQGGGLTWWDHSNPPRNKYIDELVPQYKKANPGVSIEYHHFPMTPFHKKLAVALSTKTAPDMFTLLDLTFTPLVEKKTLAHVHPEWLGYKSLEDMKAAYLPGALDGWMYEGKLYGIPFSSSTFSLYLRMKDFREAGLDPDKDYPRTWDDLLRLGQKLVKRDASGRITHEGFDFAMHSSTWTMWQMEPMIRQFGGSVLDASGKKCVANSPAGVKAFQFRVDLVYKYKISDPTVSFATNSLPAQDLVQGQVSMFITHPGSVAQFGPEIMKGLKVVPFPQADPSKRTTTTYAFAFGINPDISPDRQKAVHEFSRFLLKDPKAWLGHTAYPVPLKGFLDIPGVRQHPYIDVFIQDISAGRFVTRSAKFLEIADAMHRAMQRVVLNRVAPKQSLDQACKEIDAALAKP